MPSVLTSPAGLEKAVRACGCPWEDPGPAQSWGRAQDGQLEEEKEEEFVCHGKYDTVPTETPFFSPRSSKHFTNINSGDQVVIEQLLLYYALQITTASKSLGNKSS